MPSLRRGWYESSHKMITIFALGIICISNSADFAILLAVNWTDENFNTSHNSFTYKLHNDESKSLPDLFFARATVTFFVAFFSGLAAEKMYKKKKNTELTLKFFLPFQIVNLILSAFFKIIPMLKDENTPNSQPDLQLLYYSWSVTLALLILPAYLTIIVYSYLSRMENRLLESSTGTLTEECLVRPSRTIDGPPPPYEMIQVHI